MSEPSSGRRRFLNFLLGGSAVGWLGSIVYPVIRYLAPTAGGEAQVSSVKAATVSELKPNSGKIFKFGTKPALLIRKEDGSFVSFTGKCTHLDCIVQYRNDLKQVWCACHNGLYDMNGINVGGPPPRPLEMYDVHVKGEDVFVTRKA